MLPHHEIQRLRAQFPVTGRYAYFNNAGVAPTSLAVRDAVAGFVDELCHHGLSNEEAWEAEVERVRAGFAALIGARTDEVAFVRNTSHGLSLVAEGLDWQPGDQVAVAVELEYPSNIYPWQHLASRGVEVVPIAVAAGGVGVSQVAAALTPRTRLVAVSSAQYASGAVTPLAAIGGLLAERDVLYCVDGIQTVGALPVDVERAGIHFLAADSHKWLLGMPGIGALYVAPEVLDRVRPVLVGWKSTTKGWDFDRAHFELLPNARKFEEGSPAYALIFGLGRALDLLLSLGSEAVLAHLRSLTERLAAGLTEMALDVGPGPEQRRHITSFALPDGRTAMLHERLLAKRIVVSLRRGRIRVSPHVYNTGEEIDRLLETVRQFVAG